MQPNNPTTWARITAEITFLTADEGGRKIAPPFPGYWFLHVVIQDRSVRKAIKQGQNILEMYHPLRIIEAPVGYQLGQSATFVLTPMYYPEDPFPEFKPGATFTAREGSKIIAHGIVLSRTEGDGEVGY